MPRRPLRFLLLIVALGILTNVAVAWLLTLDMHHATVPMRFARAGFASDGEAVSVTRRDSFGAIALTAAAMPEGSFAILPEQEFPLDVVVPRWAKDDLLGWIDDDPLPFQWAEARAVLVTGWPLPCMFSAYDQQPATNYWWFKARDGIVIANAPAVPNMFAPLSPRERVLPVRVVVFPFVVSALFWMLPWTLMLLGPGLIQRTIRRRRGQCAACGYELRGLAADAPCPECGATR